MNCIMLDPFVGYGFFCFCFMAGLGVLAWGGSFVIRAEKA